MIRKTRVKYEHQVVLNFAAVNVNSPLSAPQSPKNPRAEIRRTEAGSKFSRLLPTRTENIMIDIVILWRSKIYLATF